GHAALYVGIHFPLLGGFRERIEHVSELVIAGPYLTLGNCLHGLAKQIERAISAKDAVGAEPECFDNQVRLGSFESYERPRIGIDPAYFRQQADARERSILQIGTHDCDMRASLLDTDEDLGGCRSRSDHLKPCAHHI